MIPWAKPYFNGLEEKYVTEAIQSTWISGLGPFITQFEKSFAARNGAPHCLTVSNGTTALQLALLGLGVGPGDEVIVPGFTFVAPAHAVYACGATPIFVDIDPRTWLIDPEKVQRAITWRTKAIIAVHLYGNVCEMDQLLKIADTIPIVEDTAEAPFSDYQKTCAGTIGAVGAFSFHATKLITMGEGGAVVTKDDALAAKMRVLRDYGTRPGKRYWHDAIGFNFRLTNMQAAVGCAQLETLSYVIGARSNVYTQYLAGLNFSGVTLQHFDADVFPVVWAVALKLDPAAYPQGRDAVIKQLDAVGIEVRPGFYSFHEMPIYKAPYLPVSGDVAAHVISLPMFPELANDAIARVCEALKKLRV